jgi:hypothetical protein
MRHQGIDIFQKWRLCRYFVHSSPYPLVDALSLLFPPFCPPFFLAPLFSVSFQPDALLLPFYWRCRSIRLPGRSDQCELQFLVIYSVLRSVLGAGTLA